MTMKKIIGCLLVVFTVCLSMPFSGYALVSTGAVAPAFELKDVNGKAYSLSQMKESSLTVIYFFDVDSRSSQEGLLSLNQLVASTKSNLKVIAITGSSPGKVTQFIKSNRLSFPVLLDSGPVRTEYKARQILPVICTVGPGLKVLDFFQGGGKTTEKMLARVAERELQRKNTVVAKAISKSVVKKDPKNLAARKVVAAASTKDGDLKEAEAECRSMLSEGSEGAVQGKECQAQVFLKSGKYDDALKLAREVEKLAPDRSFVHVIKGDALYAKNRKAEAKAEYELATKKKSSEPYQEAVAYNRLGRLQDAAGKKKEAQELFDKAVTIDPYYVEVTTNKGLSYESEGKWDQALKTYQQALTIDKGDIYAIALARRAQEMLDLQKDTDRSKRIDQLVKDLAARFKSQKTDTKEEDVWTSRPMVITFLDFEEKGGLAERSGMSAVFTAELTRYLNASGRVKVVERALMDRLLSELNIGSSELADPATALKLGKVLAAKLIVTGSLIHQPQSTTISFRLIDTETSDIPQTTIKQLGPKSVFDQELFQYNRDILKTVITKYPLRGYIVKAANNEAVINLGSSQGVVAGTSFDLLEETKPIEFKGKTLRSAPKIVGQLEVVRVEPDLAYVRPGNKQTPLTVEAKIQERLDQTAGH
jgi:tetratricopeptide (TPR) repeat protein/peroxiredoxin